MAELDIAMKYDSSSMEAVYLRSLKGELERMAYDWKVSAEALRRNKGQHTREKRPDEILENCAYTILELLRNY